jgi:hypothetical protein
MKTLALCALALLYWLLHQDLWNWRAARPLLFGFLPPGLSYHALYTLGVSALMALLVRTAWPTELEREVESSADGSND